MTKRSTRFVAAILATMMLMIAMPASAAAMQAQTMNARTTVAAVPNCVITRLDDSGFFDYLTVTNKCKTAKRIKVMLANRRDFQCLYYARGVSYEYRWRYPGRFDGLKSC
jgi:hypothetical protein